jgi:8-oxo-dGTP diphosphatase
VQLQTLAPAAKPAEQQPLKLEIKVALTSDAKTRESQANGQNFRRQVVAALLVRDRQVLICQRTRDQALPLKWEFPGGKVEPGETREAALKRELQEELGIDAEIGRQVASVRHRYRRNSEFDLHFFVVESYAGELTNNIFEDIRWEELRNLPRYDFLEADLRFVRELAAGTIL